MNNEQRARIEKTWTPVAGVSIPHYVENMEKVLTRFAEADLRAARKPGGNIVAGTHLGNLDIQFNGGVYLIDYTMNGEHLGKAAKKAEAVEFLVNAYRVVNE